MKHSLLFALITYCLSIALASIQAEFLVVLMLLSSLGFIALSILNVHNLNK